MSELDKCIKFLEANGYINVTDGFSEEGYKSMYKENADVSAIDLNDDEIVFLSDAGDWLHIPCNYYALIGAMIQFRQIDVGFARLYI
jgi:hypothetical protein